MSPDDVAILTRAKQIVAEGWIQHMSRDVTGRVCAGQALTNACMELVEFSLESTTAIRMWQAKLNETSALLLTAALEETGRDWGNVPNWNDFEGRTLDEVLDTFDHAIKLAERDSRAPVATRAG